MANPEGEAERHRRYRQAHYEEEIARGRRYYKTHRSQQTQYRRRYYETHQEQCANYTHRWHVAHREERAVSNRVYYLEHIGQQTAYARHYSKTHPGWSASRSRIKRARKLGAGGVHTAADVLAQYERQHARCFYCNVKLGSYHVDHVMPLKLGGSNGSENLVVACPSCNLSKGATHPMDFSGRML